MLNKFSEAIRTNLTKNQRLKIVALVTIEVHARDIIEHLAKSGVIDANSFEWLKELRFYWDRDIDDCIARQTNTQFQYAYEYLGNSGRLVITPLTDRWGFLFLLLNFESLSRTIAPDTPVHCVLLRCVLPVFYLCVWTYWQVLHHVDDRTSFTQRRISQGSSRNWKNRDGERSWKGARQLRHRSQLLRRSWLQVNGSNVFWIGSGEQIT